MKKLNRFIVADAVDYMKRYMMADVVDLTVTSPPYENLRNYNGYHFDAESMLAQLYRVTKPGGVVVWVIGDKINSGRSLNSFEHAFIARECGFTIHDVMIFQKRNTPFMRSNAYTNCFEFMHIFTKGKPKTFHPIQVPTVRNGIEMVVSNKGPDAINNKVPVELKKQKTKTNIWQYAVGFGGTTKDKIAFQHPAVFPEALARDHILSWSNPNDFIFDPMCGSGTTCKMASMFGRKWLGIDMSEEYVGIAQVRMKEIQVETCM